MSKINDLVSELIGFAEFLDLEETPLVIKGASMEADHRSGEMKLHLFAEVDCNELKLTMSHADGKRLFENLFTVYSTEQMRKEKTKEAREAVRAAVVDLQEMLAETLVKFDITTAKGEERDEE